MQVELKHFFYITLITYGVIYLLERAPALEASLFPGVTTLV